MSFINEEKIHEWLSENRNPSRQEIEAVVAKARECKGLSLEETAKLINIENQEDLELVFAAAKEVKDKIYGKRIVLFAPLYTSNECTNNCLYCGFRAGNRELHRKTLSVEEIVRESKAIEQQGHKRILMVCGEDKKKTHISHITDALAAVYANCDIRRINVNAAPLTVEEFKQLKEAGIGTYQLFQETYHRATYRKMHPSGSKADYDWRVTAMERAIEAGIDDFGIGALLGLYDYKFEVLAMLQHSEYLMSKFNVGPHTISVPRLRPALGSAITETPYPMSELEFKKLVAVLRLAVPYTGIILSTRESAVLRDQLLDLGVSQISAGSKTSPGGYDKEEEKADQFDTNDHRTLPEMVRTICDSGYIPSFCTACYRRCRTGENFMELAKEGEIHTFCQPNAILTFKENLLDYATEEDRVKGEKIIQKALEEIEDQNLRKITVEKLEELNNGKRDLYL